MNFVLKMDFDSFKPEFQYFDIYPHHFWLAAHYSINFQAWSVMSLMCVSLQMTAVILSLRNGLIHAGNKPFTFSVSLLFEIYSTSVTVNWSIDLTNW